RCALARRKRRGSMFLHKLLSLMVACALPVTFFNASQSVGPSGVERITPLASATLATVSAGHRRAQILFQGPRLVIDAPAGGATGYTVTFRWHLESGAETQAYTYKVRLDKGPNACDNGIEEEFDAGAQTCLRVELPASRYRNAYIDFAVQATDAQNRKTCVSGRNFFVDPQLPPAPLCAALPLSAASAASFGSEELAAESIVAVFGQSLTTTTAAATALPLPLTLAGTSGRVRDSVGNERTAPLFFVSPGQINLLLPPGTADGPAQMSVTHTNGAFASGTFTVSRAAPGLFAANANGQGVAAAIVYRRRADGSESSEPVAQFNAAQNRFVAVPIDLGPASDQIVLALFGTGLRFRSALMAVTCTFGGLSVPVSFAGAQGALVGLDQ